MNRRIFGLALSSTVLLPFETRAATATLTFLSLTPSPPPATRGDIYGYPKGTIGFKFYRGATSKSPISATLTSYGNNGGDGRYQCVNLITAFAKALQLPSFVTGNGNQCASNLAANSGGAFQYVLNGAAALPKLGAVISTDTWLGQQLNAAGTAYTPVYVPGAGGKTVREVVPGHVGIVQAISTSGLVTLFDQNMPVPGAWRTIQFTKVNGKWYGVMRNTGLDINVLGWANPIA